MYTLLRPKEAGWPVDCHRAPPHGPRGAYTQRLTTRCCCHILGTSTPRPLDGSS